MAAISRVRKRGVLQWTTSHAASSARDVGVILYILTWFDENLMRSGERVWMCYLNYKYYTGGGVGLEGFAKVCMKHRKAIRKSGSRFLIYQHTSHQPCLGATMRHRLHGGHYGGTWTPRLQGHGIGTHTPSPRISTPSPSTIWHMVSHARCRRSFSTWWIMTGLR
jgi:hypothetical protein